MEEQVEITTNLCHENVCNNVILKLTKTEVSKLQSVIIYDNSPSLNIDYEVASQFWGVAFFSVITLWLFSKGVGTIINLVKRA